MTPSLRSRSVAAGAALILAAAIGYYFVAYQTPAARRLTDLNAQSLGAFRNDFNRAADKTRVILLLSPT